MGITTLYPNKQIIPRVKYTKQDGMSITKTRCLFPQKDWSGGKCTIKQAQKINGSSFSVLPSGKVSDAGNEVN